MKSLKPKILIIEHDSTNMELIHNELIKSNINYTSEIVQTKKAYIKALHDFKPDIILSNYTFPAFDGLAAFKIRKKLAPQTPFIFVSESIGEEITIELIKNGVSDFVLNGNLSTLATKMNRALKEAKIINLNNEHKQSENKRIEELDYNAQKYYSLIESSMDAILLTVKDGQILAANTAACKIFQMTQEEICSSGRLDVVDITDPRLQPLLDERNLNGKARGELTFKRKDGSRFPGEITSVVYTDANGLEKTSMTIKDISGQKLAEAKQLSTSNALQEALNERNKILDSSLDVICSFDEQGIFDNVSAASESLWGYKSKELKGKNIMDLVFNEDAEITKIAFATIRNGKAINLFENKIKRKNGELITMCWTLKWDAKDKLMYCSAKDATEKKSMEKAFDIERQRFLDLYSQAPSIMVILKGPNYLYEMANLPYLKLINRTNIIGKTVKEVLPELEAQGIFKFLDAVYQTGETFTANEMLVKTDFYGNGQLVDTYLNFIYQAYRNNVGDIEGIFFFAVNVTEQVVSRNKVEESEKRFRALIEKSEEMITLSTKNGEIIYGSPSIKKIFGYTLKEIPNKFSFNFIHPDDINDFIEKRSKILETPGASFYHQQRVLHKNGNWIWCENTITNMLHEPGIHALVANFRDITEKKITEQQREFDRKNLSALINNTNDLMWSVDRDFNLITSNKPFKAMTTRILGNTIKKGSNILASRFSPDILQNYKISCERAFAGKTFTEIEYREIPVEMWTEISYHPIRKDNEIIGTACSSRNITAQKQNELNLKNQNKTLIFHIKEKEKMALKLHSTNKELSDYKFAMDQSSIVGITDEKGIIKYANDNFCKISKYSREELIGQDHRIINSGFHPKAFFQIMWKTLVKGETWKGEIKNKAKDGTIYWVDSTITPFLNENGKPYQYVATRFDITERKQAELILEKQNKELVFQNHEKEKRANELSIANDKLAIQNAENEKRANEISIFNIELAYQNEERENREAELIIANEELAFQNEEKENRAAELIIANKELAFQNKEKENRAAELTRINTELLKTNTELDRFVYSVSHDLRSPLTSIQGLISFIAEESRETETLEHIEMIRTNVNRLDEFIKNILSYSRNNRTGLEVETISPQETANEIVDTLRAMKEAEGIRFEIDISEQQVFYSDRIRFYTVIENLLSNAIKYHHKNKPGRYIKITGQSDHEKLQLTITDNGIGIAKKYHAKIFEMFFRITGKKDGSGIGLYIVKDTIQILQGSIEVQSEEGKGTSFHITLKNLKP